MIGTFFSPHVIIFFVGFHLHLVQNSLINDIILKFGDESSEQRPYYSPLFPPWAFVSSLLQNFFSFQSFWFNHSANYCISHLLSNIYHPLIARIPIVHNGDMLLLELLCPDSHGSQWKYRSEAIMIWRIRVIVLLQQYYLYLLNCAANFCLSIAFYAFLFPHKIGSCYSKSPVSKPKTVTCWGQSVRLLLLIFNRFGSGHCLEKNAAVRMALPLTKQTDILVAVVKTQITAY